MPWDNARGPSNPKYRSKAHREERAKYAKVMRLQGFLICQQPICVEPERTIHDGEPWHLGHAEDGVTYIGPVHASCNVKDGARRARAKQETSDINWLEDEPAQPWLRKDYHPCPACGATVTWASQRQRAPQP